MSEDTDSSRWKNMRDIVIPFSHVYQQDVMHII